MHILYVDDSGSVNNPKERFFVLGGVSVFERGLYHLMTETDACVAAMGLGSDTELHATDMYSGGRGVWKGIKSRATREKHINSVISLLAKPQASIRLFAIAVDKEAVHPHDPVKTAFEEMCNRFNLFIQRRNARGAEGAARNRDEQRGLIIMDEYKDEEPLQKLARGFRTTGGRWGQFRCLAEVPLFADSKSTRLLQLADLVAWSTFRRFEYSDGRFFDPLVQRFDADDGVIHGLFHAKGSKTELCYCPACVTRGMRDARNERKAP